jgi:cobalamin biosynthesis protein CobT
MNGVGSTKRMFTMIPNDESSSDSEFTMISNDGSSFDSDEDDIIFDNTDDEDSIIFESHDSDLDESYSYDEEETDTSDENSDDDNEDDIQSTEEKIINNFKMLSFDNDLDLDEVIEAFHNTYTTEELDININEINKHDQEETIGLKTINDAQNEDHHSCRVTFNNNVKVFYTYSTEQMTRSNTYYVDLERHLRAKIGTIV